MQKKVINDLPPEQRDARFFRSLIKSPLWFLGLLCQLAFGAILFMIAVDLIGPTIPPGLMATGLIVLAIGSVKIVHESLKKTEILGIALMIVAIVLLGLSDLEINADITTFLDPGFLNRTTIYTIIVIGIIIGCYIGQHKSQRGRGILIVLASGCFFALSNFWTSPLMGTIDILGGVGFSWGKLALFVTACMFLVLSNIFGTGSQQTALKYGQASLLITIQQIPTEVAPIFYYFSVFNLWPVHPEISIPFLVLSIAFSLIAMFLLSKRQVMLEEIK
ncbi:MAG TPA: hypothetical protein VKK79_08775 [Candidatus Lokiarchaeia archaeon]|nr:hypothetical protein [Candidatus Lokiarchaeia archaeon]